MDTEDQSGEKPLITTPIRGTLCEPGDKAFFECIAESSSPVSTVWLKNNQLLDDKLADRVIPRTSGKTHRLDLMNCRLSDAGLYTARITNEAGFALCSAQLIVQELTEDERKKLAEANHPIFVVKFKDTELVENSCVRLLVKVKGDPNPSVEFKKDGKPLIENDRIQVIQEQAANGSYELLISHVKQEDTGKYICSASNRFGEAITEAELTVTDESVISALFKTLPAAIPGDSTQFSWFKGGQPFEPDERFKVLFKDEEDSLALVFQHVKPEDAGMYTCVAATTSGKISCSAELTVEGGVYQSAEPMAPEFTVNLVDSEVSVGGSAMLELKLGGFPKPKVQWFRGGDEVKAGGRYRFLFEDDESIALIIKGVSTDDAGLYTVIATNELGEAKTEGNLYVKAPPKFKKKMSDMSCMTDQPFRVDIEVEGSPAPQVQWYKDGKQISSSEKIRFVQEKSETYSLIIEEVSFEDSGSYSVVASNAMGQMSEFFAIDALAPPRFLKRMKELFEGEIGQDVTLEVEVQANPKPEVRWFQGDTEIKHDGKKYIVDEKDCIYTLTVKNLTRRDSGKFKCKIENPHGGDESAANVKVKASPEVTKPLEGIVVKEGDKNVAFEISVNAYPEPTVRWFIGEMEITEEKNQFKKVYEEGAYKLLIEDVAVDMAGSYTVKLENEKGSYEASATLSVKTPPKITGQLLDTIVNEGQSCTLKVSATGVPEPEVKWFKDGSEVTADANVKITKETTEIYSLTFNLVTKKDSGNYECVLTNEMGEVRSSCTLQVQYKPTIISDNFKNLDAWEEDEVVLKIIAEGVPRPKAKWSKDGNSIELSDSYVLIEEETSYQMKILRAELSDSGDYSVTIENEVGSEHRQEIITIKSLAERRVPKILKPFDDTTAIKGEQLVLEAKVCGDPRPKVEWYKNGKIASESDNVIVSDDGETLYTIVVNCIKQSDGGKYTVIASNEHGEDKYTGVITIHSKPNIVGLQAAEVEFGQSATFQTVVAANPKPKIEWLKDGQKLKKENWIHTTNDEKNNAYILEVKEVKVADGGIYTLKASNEIGEVSAEAKLTVIYSEPVFKTPLTQIIVKEGADTELIVEVDGIPRPSVEWFFNDNKIEISELILITAFDKKSSLTIKGVSSDNLGKYSVKAKNAIGEAITEADLQLYQSVPSIAQGLEPFTNAKEGEVLSFSVKLDGSPIPTYKWLKDNNEIIPNDRIEIIKDADNNVKLVVKDADPDDSGAYRLLAINPNGQISTETVVAVQPSAKKPSFNKKLKDQTVSEGKALKLDARVIAFPKPEVKWVKDGRAIYGDRYATFEKPDGSIGLDIDNVKAEDAGKYTLVVTNDLGETKTSAEVKVEAAPSMPSILSPLQPIKVVTGYPALLEVKVSGFPIPHLNWTQNGEPVNIDGSHIKGSDKPDTEGWAKLVIEAAEPDDSGDYVLTATNSEGKATSKAPMEVIGGLLDGPEIAPFFVSPLKDQYVEEGSGLRLSCSVAGNPVPQTSWLKDDQPIPANKGIVSYDGDKMSLEIPILSIGDAGRYEATLTNPLGKESCSANVQVRKIYQAPDFVQRFSNVQQLPSFDARFLCKVTGVPRPEVTWYRDNQPLTDSEKYHIKRDGDLAVLFVCDVTPEDAGTYSCHAKNIDGQVQCDGSLEIVDKIEKQERAEAPAFMKRIGDCEVYEGMTAKFTACATGFPEPDFEFYRNGTLLFPSERIKIAKEANGLIRLTIKHVHEGDVGRYKLRVYNPHGDATCEADLCYDSLESRPKRPLTDQYADFDRLRKTGVPLPLADRPIISGMTDRYLTLSWKPSIPIGPREPVTYMVEMSDCPDGEWFTVRNRILGNVCDIRNLDPQKDYRFRIRVENKYGLSDPSPYAITYRENLHVIPTKRPMPGKAGEIPDFGHSIEGMKYPPTFLRQEQEASYALRHHSTSLHWYLYGYPRPEIRFTYDGLPITMGGKFESAYQRDGEATLFISRMLEKDVGVYECVATNEHGEARQRIKLELAEHPVFIDRPSDVVFMVRKPGRIVCKICGVPAPDVKWYKDWKPLAPSSRVKIQSYDSDTFILSITDVIQKDEGLYSVVARNVAGAAQASLLVRVEENEEDFNWSTYNRLRTVKTIDKSWDDFYDAGNEIGRGTQAIIKHVVDRINGISYAAKIMNGNDSNVRPKMLHELEMMNQFNHRRLVRVVNAFETKKTVTLITELCGGGTLLDSLTSQANLTESEIAAYIRQVLQALEHMHSRGYAHLGLTPGDVLISRPGGDEIKICDFSLTRRVGSGKLMSLDYGMPEFVAPEIANGEGVGTPADIWSVGVITYLLLSGISPFRGGNDRETLSNVQKGQINFDVDAFSSVSCEAKDFIAKLLVFQGAGRLNVRDALEHPWLKTADREMNDSVPIPTDRLKSYYLRLKEWYSNASCRTWFRRRPLSGAFIDPSKMVYPPGESNTPRGTPARENGEKGPIRVEVNGYDRPDYQVEVISSESQYQMGPDTFLLPLRDPDFPARLRRYMKVAQQRSPTFTLRLNEHNFDKSLPIIRERRRFTDIMDEEIDDEKKNRINRYVTDRSFSPTARRLRHEVGTRLECANQAEAIIEAKRHGKVPFFREKPKTVAIVEDKPIEMSCFVVGDPKPRVEWYKNEVMLLPGSRISIKEDDKGRSILRFESAMSQDVGIYKVVARNDSGQVTARARLVIGDLPSQPDSPDVSCYSDTEVLLKWKVPKDDGNSPILCYNLQYRGTGETEWRDVANNIDHEFYLVRELKGLHPYIFRISARNAFGWSEKSIPSETVTTRETGAPPVQITRAMKYLQQLTESGKTIETDQGKSIGLDYSAETNPVELHDNPPTEDYSFIAEIARGQFSFIAKCVRKSTDTIYTAKALSRNDEDAAKAEVEKMRTLRHERVATLIEAYTMPSHYIMILEKLQGMDVLTYLSNLHEYTEQMVATIVNQVLDALQYLHWRGLGYLDLQFDNIVLTSSRTVDVKLVDFGCAEPVSKLGTLVKQKGLLEYTAPEVLAEEPAYPQSDIWSLGAMTYTLLSGVSPFKGETNEETRQNIVFVRYRFEPLHKEITMEATRFLMLIFKRAPLKRPATEECLENRWLQPTEFMLKKRQRAVFLGNRLKDFSNEYHSLRNQKATKDDQICLALGMGFNRSPSTQYDSLTSF